MTDQSILRPALQQFGTNTPIARTLELLENEVDLVEISGGTAAIIPTTTAVAILPAVGFGFTVPVTSTAVLGIGQDVFLPGIGYLTVFAVGAGNVSLRNDGLTGIAPAGTTIPLGTEVQPAGAVGAPGMAGGAGLIRFPFSASAASTTIVPPGNVVTEVAIDISAAFPPGTTISVGTATNPTLLMAPGDTNPTLVANQVVLSDVVWPTPAQPILVTVTGPAGSGAATCSVTAPTPSS